MGRKRIVHASDYTSAEILAWLKNDTKLPIAQIAPGQDEEYELFKDGKSLGEFSSVGKMINKLFYLFRDLNNVGYSKISQDDVFLIVWSAK